MPTRNKDRKSSHSMAALGVDECAERVYRMLLRQPGSSSQGLAELTNRPSDEICKILAELRNRGLARTEEGTAVSAWFATAPDVAVELLLMARQAELNEARLVLHDLQREVLQGAQLPRSGGIQFIDDDPRSQLQAYLHVHQCASADIAVVLCPPFGVSAPDEIESARLKARERGVRFRLLLDSELLHLQGWTEAAQLAIANGDDIRMLATLPFKMVLADHNIGLVPLMTGTTAGPSLLLGAGAVLDAMYLVFEGLWRDAAPANVVFGDATQIADPADRDLSILLSLLASGSNDKTIADTLGISERTLQRRLQMLHTRLGARTRFHCGWLAARHIAGR